MENKDKLKKLEWKNPNKILINTGHKKFDNQTNLISTGNVCANTQYSGFIRHWNNEGEGLIDYPKNKRKPGHLFNFDMNIFKKVLNIPNWIVSIIAQEAKERNKSMILYCFFHHNNHPHSKGRIIHGYILTDYNYKHIQTFYTGPTYKSYDIISECKKYISYD